MSIFTEQPMKNPELMAKFMDTFIKLAGNQKRVMIVHHNDADGRMAATIAKMYYMSKDQDCKLYAMDYNMEFQMHKEYQDETIVIVDFSFKPDIMKRLITMTDDIIWIDHHATAKSYETDYGRKLKGLRNFTNKGPAGCELTWKYYYPTARMPEAVNLIGTYDAWRDEDKEHFKRATDFMEGLKCVPDALKPGTDFWLDLVDPTNGYDHDDIEDIVDDGVLASAYRDNYCRELREAFGYEIDWEGHKCYALNAYKFGSLVYGPEIMKKYDVAIGYIHDGKKYMISLYSEKDIDVSAICKKHGGGGHKGAGGFTVAKLPWLTEESKQAE